MKVLLIKTSSMGDVVHALPAVTDAVMANPAISFDWVVEESFKDIPEMHPSVDRVIPVAVRKWRKAPFKYLSDIRSSIKDIKKGKYDVVIDAQGLIKSAFFTHFARGEKYGLSKISAKEPLASMAYDFKIDVPKGLHAIERVRHLFARSIGYEFNSDALSYGLRKNDFIEPALLTQPYVVFLHGTTWASKHWPIEYWKELVLKATNKGFSIYLPWGIITEQKRAEELSRLSKDVHVLPRSSIKQLAGILMHARGVVGVDSGLSHLAAACGTAVVTLYGSTSAKLTGTMGEKNTALQAAFKCSPCLRKECDYSIPTDVQPACYQELVPKAVWGQLEALMK